RGLCPYSQGDSPLFRIRSLARFGVVAKDAAFIPERALAVKLVGIRREEGAVGVNPAALDNVIRHGQAPVAALLVLGEAFLEPVPANQADDLQFFRRRRAELLQRLARLSGPIGPFALDGLHEKLVTVAGHARRRAMVAVDSIGKVALDELRCRLARHRAMIGAPPAFVIVAVALGTG